MANDVLFQVLRFISTFFYSIWVPLQFLVAQTLFHIFFKTSMEVLWRFPLHHEITNDDYTLVLLVSDWNACDEAKKKVNISFCQIVFEFYAKVSKNQDEKCKQYYLNILNCFFFHQKIRLSLFSHLKLKLITFTIFTNWPNVLLSKWEPSKTSTSMNHTHPALHQHNTNNFLFFFALLIMLLFPKF